MKSETGFVLYDVICDEMGKAAVDSLTDITSCILDQNLGIVTPELACSYVAMKGYWMN